MDGVELKGEVTMKCKFVLLPLMLGLILINIFPMVSANNWQLSTNDVYQSGNENYSFASAMTFTRFGYNSTMIFFNNLYFNISSNNAINITLSYLNPNILTASLGETLLRFNANTSAGRVWFNLSGFETSTLYTVLRDSETLHTYKTSAGGVLSFYNETWSDHDYEIRKGDTSLSRQVRIRYNSEAMEDVEDIGFSAFPLMALVAVVMVAAAIMIIVSRR